MSSTPAKLSNELQAFALGKGAALAGVADMALLRGIATIPDGLTEQYPRAVSIAVKLRDKAVDSVVDRPTASYDEEYFRANKLLDGICSTLERQTQERGYKAMAVPASQIIDWENYRGSLPHQAIARAAGLGWQGKSLLIVTPQFGPRVRLGTVITDMPLMAGSPIRNRCGKCRVCADSCPSRAIKGVGTRSHYTTAFEAMDLKKCHQQLLQFRKSLQLKHASCGICVSACPWGKRSASAATKDNP